jgi:hypothetical protein
MPAGWDSTESEPGYLLNSSRRAHHIVHTRQRRSVLQPSSKRFDGLWLALRECFHATIGKIARVTDQAQLQRTMPRQGAKADPLDTTTHEKSFGLHLKLPV